MKRFFLALVALYLFFLPTTALAAEHVKWGFSPVGGNLWELKVDWKVDGSGDLTETTLNSGYYDGTDYGGLIPWMDLSVYMIGAVTLPGTEAPDANYEVLLDDAHGVKIFGTALDDCAAATDEDWQPDIPYRPCKMPWSFDVTNAGSGDEEGVVYFYFIVPE